MITPRWLPMLFAGALLLPGEAFAFGVVLQYEGEVDDRVAYFADVRTILNRTPPDQVMGPTEIREIAVTAVYENANKPEFVHMKLQFQCSNAFSMDMASRKITENKNKVRPDNVVTFRIGPGSYKLRRSDLKTEAVAASDWKTSSAPMLSKAGTIACNDIEFDKALHAAIKGGTFDFEGFGKRIGKLGLPEDMLLIGATLPSEFLDFAWDSFWWDKVLAKKRPDPSGKWAQTLSEADRQAAIEKLKRKQQELESGTASIRAGLLESIKKTNAEMKADLEVAKNAGKHPDGSKMNKHEAKLAAVFIGQPEQKVVDIMGNPDDFNQTADARFLRYSAWWEQQGVTVYGAQGVIGGDPGGYAECFAEFSVRPDASGEWRVDDIVVRGDYEGTGSREIRLVCNDAIRPKR
ncbi:hypothetical protein [Rhodanobacter lindaniclasticus]|nr:hypothetical protein [Rhodanobacter lindaniclasticus]HCZ14837.1 hypothetical protein [Accumulibacter sp.]